jgi:histidine triad (HIT) family protein
MSDTAHCTFCNLIAGAAEVSVCYEDADALAFMDIQPVNAGHVLVVPRQHHESVLDVPQELGVHLFRVTMRLVAAVKRVSGCEGINIVVNSGAVAGQDEMHYHVHIIPRQKNDGFDIPLPFGGSEMPDRTVLDMHAARIIAALRDPMGRSDRGGSAAGQEGKAPKSAGAGAAIADGADAGGRAGERQVETPLVMRGDIPLAPDQRTPENRTADDFRIVGMAVLADAPGGDGDDSPLEVSPRLYEGAHGELVSGW